MIISASLRNSSNDTSKVAMKTGMNDRTDFDRYALNMLGSTFRAVLLDQSLEAAVLA